MHAVVFPFAVVVAALFVVEFASSIAFAIEFVAFILGAYFVLLNSVFQLMVEVWVGAVL